ncbi:MAG: hypothetical protein KTR14_10860 [Vampirovibrio sp.]|nr:hypothetical protein [Vampirovibrio sp.]
MVTNNPLLGNLLSQTMINPNAPAAVSSGFDPMGGLGFGGVSYFNDSSSFLSTITGQSGGLTAPIWGGSGFSSIFGGNSFGAGFGGSAGSTSASSGSMDSFIGQALLQGILNGDLEVSQTNNNGSASDADASDKSGDAEAGSTDNKSSETESGDAKAGESEPSDDKSSNGSDSGEANGGSASAGSSSGEPNDFNQMLLDLLGLRNSIGRTAGEEIRNRTNGLNNQTTNDILGMRGIGGRQLFLGESGVDSNIGLLDGIPAFSSLFAATGNLSGLLGFGFNGGLSGILGGGGNPAFGSQFLGFETDSLGGLPLQL